MALVTTNPCSCHEEARNSTLSLVHTWSRSRKWPLVCQDSVFQALIPRISRRALTALTLQLAICRDQLSCYDTTPLEYRQGSTSLVRKTAHLRRCSAGQSIDMVNSGRPAWPDHTTCLTHSAASTSITMLTSTYAGEAPEVLFVAGCSFQLIHLQKSLIVAHEARLGGCVAAGTCLPHQSWSIEVKVLLAQRSEQYGSLVASALHLRGPV